MPAEIDYSTLNVSVLMELPEAVIALGGHVSESRGQGCFMDPPGYPSHFLQSVYTAKGDNPRKGSETVIFHPETGYREVSNAAVYMPSNWKPLCRRLWVPLPFESERVQGWLADAAGYLRSTEKDGPYQREFYPEYTGEGIIPAYGSGSIGDWVNLHAERPADGAACVAQQRLKYGHVTSYWNRHPLNNTWCQHCGWVQPKDTAVQEAAHLLCAALQQLDAPEGVTP